MGIIVGKEKKVQKRVERADVLNGIKEKRMENDRRKEEQKALAEAEEAAREEAKASKVMERAKSVRGRKPKAKDVVEPVKEECDE